MPPTWGAEDRKSVSVALDFEASAGLMVASTPRILTSDLGGPRRYSGAFTWLHECEATSTRLAGDSPTA